VSIGLTSYNGGVYYGLNADREAMADVDVLAALIEESLAELVAASDTTASHRENGSASTSPVVPGSRRVVTSTRRSTDATSARVTSETESSQRETAELSAPPLDVSSEAQPDELAQPKTASTYGKVALSPSPNPGSGTTSGRGDGTGPGSPKSSRAGATAGAAHERSGDRQTGGSSGTATASDSSSDPGPAAELTIDSGTVSDQAASADPTSDGSTSASDLSAKDDA